MDTWRKILAAHLEQGGIKEKQRIAKELGILSLRTLDRWAEELATPKNSQLLVSLSRIVPDMEEALREAFPDAFKGALSGESLRFNESKDIPPEFFWRILHGYTTIPASNRYWTIANLVLEQVIKHIDPDENGLAIVFAQLLKQEIHLYEGGGSAIWSARQLRRDRTVTTEAYAEFLAILRDGRPHFIIPRGLVVNQQWEHFGFFLHTEEIKTMAIYPVQRGWKYAGALFFCSCDEDFFFLRRRQLLDSYVHLYALAYADRDFQSIE